MDIAVEKRDGGEEERAKKRVSILTPEEEKLRAKKKPAMTVRFQDDVKNDDVNVVTGELLLLFLQNALNSR